MFQFHQRKIFCREKPNCKKNERNRVVIFLSCSVFFEKKRHIKGKRRKENAKFGLEGKMRSNLAEAYAYPEYVPVRKRRTKPDERVRRVKKAAGKAKNRKRVVRAEMDQSIPLLLMLTVAVIATLYICFNYLALQNSITSKMDNIEVLERTLEDLKTENDALEQSINTSVDLNYVYDVAVNELGMVHAGQENVIYYDKTENEYVRQYENIPKI